MIFVSLGSREYQFNRLLKELDRLLGSGQFQEEIFAQIGGSDYLPQHYPYARFLDKEQFEAKQQAADLIISHAGTGALIGALKKGKKVISVPRLAKYGEHIDDHQLQVSGVLAEEGYLEQVLDVSMLGDAIRNSLDNPVKRYFEKPSKIIESVAEFLRFC